MDFPLQTSPDALGPAPAQRRPTLSFDSCIALIDQCCGGRLRKPRVWHAHLWQQGLHRAIVLCPQRNETFEMAVVNEVACHLDGVEDGTVAFDWGIVLELRLDGDLFHLRCSVLYDFEPTDDGFTSLGFTNKIAFLTCEGRSVVEHAKAVIGDYTRYSLIGTNCQHFVSELGFELRLSKAALATLQPQDEQLMQVVPAIGGVLIVGSAVTANAMAATATTTTMASISIPTIGLTIMHGTTATSAAHSAAFCAGVGAAGAIAGGAVTGALACGTYAMVQERQRSKRSNQGGLLCCARGR